VEDLPALAVVLDFGAASPFSILAAARRLCRVVFVCDREVAYVRSHLDDAAEFGMVCDITGLPPAAAAARIAATGAAGITTFSEFQVSRTADLADRCGFPAYHSRQVARVLTDKLAQRRVLQAAGVQATRCRPVTGLADLDDALAEVGLPAILKPRTGAGGTYSCPAASAEQAAARLREFLAAPGSPREYVAEELLPGDPAAAGPPWGDYVSVESVTSRGVTRHVEVTGKFPLTEPCRETGYFVPATLGPELRSAVLALAGSAIAALGITDGVTHLEAKLTPAGPKIIEMNGRLGGYVADILRRARGLDLVRMALLAGLGRLADVPEPSYRHCAFQYFVLPPMDATRLRCLAGAEELRQVPGIHLVETFRRAGDGLDWRQGTLSYLGIVHGSAPSHDDLLRLVRLIRRTLRVEYFT
jgi:biotin carboxylase